MVSEKLVPMSQPQYKGHVVNDPCYKEREKAAPCCSGDSGSRKSASEDITLHRVLRKAPAEFPCQLPDLHQVCNESTTVEGTGS